MNIKISRNIEVPDGFTCDTSKKTCYGLSMIADENPDKVRLCAYFNQLAFKEERAGERFVKCRDCIDATREYLRGVTK